jgi:uncharacterized repeat protein (TIGR03803 family)
MYGITSKGGEFDLGTLFRINTDGSDFRVLHSFETYSPRGEITMIGSKIYGTNSHDIYQIDTDGSNFDIINAEGYDYGGYRGVLTHDGTTLFGTTSRRVFSLEVPEPSAIVLLGFGVLGLFAWGRRRGRKG